MSFALACLHTLVFLICLARNEMAAKFYEGCWCFKFLVVAGMLIGSLWIKNEPFFYGYLHFSQWVSFFFLCFQAMLMLIVAYVINGNLIKNVNVENGEAMSCSGIILISSTIILFVGNVTWITLQYYYFNNCAFPIYQMSFTVVAGVAMYVLVLMRTRADASIFTSSLVLTYNLYLQWSGLSSNPDPYCNPFTESAGNTTFLMIMGLIFTFVSLLVISAHTYKEEEEEKREVVATSINAPLMEKETAEDIKVAEENVKREERGEKPIHKTLPITSATIFF